MFESGSEEDFQFLLDPFTGRIVLVAPAPMVAFENLESFDEFVEMLNRFPILKTVRCLKNGINL